MSYQRKKALAFGAVILTMLVLAGPTTAATRTKSSGGVTGLARLRPGTSWANQRASRHVRHARDYSRDIYRYSRDAATIKPAIMKAESEELGRNIIRARQEFAVACQEAGNDAATVASLKSIEKHLESAEKQHVMLHKECCKPTVDGGAAMDCCSKITLDLDKVQAEHDAISRSSEIVTKKSE